MYSSLEKELHLTFIHSTPCDVYLACLVRSVKILKSASRMGFLLAKNNPLPEKYQLMVSSLLISQCSTIQIFYLHLF